MKVFSVVSTKRSGHHAFIEWLCSSFKEQWVYFNHCKIVNGELHYSRLEKNVVDASIDEVPRVHSSVERVLSQLVGKDINVVFSYENRGLNYIGMCSKLEESLSDKYVDGSVVNKVFFLRDFFNSYASQVKWVDKNPKAISDLSQFKKTWAAIASLFLDGPSNFMEDKFPIVFCSYNNFMFDPAYKAEIANLLGVENVPLNKDLSVFGGGGNTFFADKESYQAEQEVLESRWELVDDFEKISSTVESSLMPLIQEFSDHIGREDLFSKPYKMIFSDYA